MTLTLVGWQCLHRGVLGVAVCKSPVPLTNAVLDHMDDAGTKAIYRCLSDNRAPFRICVNGSWGKTDPNSGCLGCVAPPPISGTSVNKLQTVYNPGDLILYSCNHGHGSFGHIRIDCRSNHKWTEQSRKCTDPSPVGPGTVAGMTLCMLVLVLVGIVYMMSSKHARPHETEPKELHVVSVASATSSDCSDAPTIPFTPTPHGDGECIETKGRFTRAICAPTERATPRRVTTRREIISALRRAMCLDIACAND
ncbi:hypothetical protein LSAT2_008536 [Lamellibrachia satsuma]|nr:hypothetical protein LSAT2_008536 [Lamellibrachia satsuma]